MSATECQYLAVNESEAVAAAEARYGDLPPGHRFVARAVEDTTLWSVVPADEQGRPYAGGSHLVGPDRRIWSVSSNPGIHDPDLAARSVAALYKNGVTDLVEDEAYHEWLRAETERRCAAIPDLIAAATAGSLRGKRPPLP